MTTTDRLGTNPTQSIKSPVVASTTADITLSGEQTIDSVAVTAGDRVLVRNQTDATENGIYDCSTSSWTRSTDFNAANDLTDGVLVLDANSDTLYQAVYTGTYDPDTTSLTFKSYIANQYLGAKASAPTLDNDGNALATGDMYFLTTDDKLYVRTSGAAWTLASANAEDVAIADSGSKYTGTDVEAALAELSTTAELAATTNGNGASLIGLEDNAAQFVATDAEAAIAEIRADLASTSNGKGASDVSIEDSATNFTATQVEAALAELMTKIGVLNTKIVEIGDWDMDATVSVNVAHGLTLAKIRSVKVLIRDDADGNYYDFNYIDNGAVTTDGYIKPRTTNVALGRPTGGFFDGTDFDSTSYNRGWLVIQSTD